MKSTLQIQNTKAYNESTFERDFVIVSMNRRGDFAVHMDTCQTLKNVNSSFKMRQQWPQAVVTERLCI